MPQDDVLIEITRSKQPYSRTRSIGELARQMSGRLSIAEARQVADLQSAFGDFAAGPLAQQCRIVAYRDGEVVVGVKSPHLVDLMRRSFVLEVREQLHARFPRLVIRNVVFKAAVR